MTKKRISIVLIISFILLGLIPFTNAKYTKESPSSGNIAVAKWLFKLNDSSDTSQVIDLSKTIITNNYSLTSLVPGVNGKITLVADCNEIETAGSYVISIADSNIPNNIHFYSDSSYQNEVENDKVFTNSFDATGERKYTHELYWKWIYTDDDESEWMGKDISISLKVKVLQKLVGDK